MQTPFSVSDYAMWTREVLTLLGVEKPHLIAHSFGCRVAVKLAAKDAVKPAAKDAARPSAKPAATAVTAIAIAADFTIH